MKVKSGGRLLHKSRTVHRDLNPVWDESVTLPIEDPFQSLTFKVNFTSLYKLYAYKIIKNLFNEIFLKLLSTQSLSVLKKRMNLF